MRLNAWQMVAVLAILFAAIICANVFAPGASAIVVSMATTAFGALFLHKDNGGGPPDPPSPNVPSIGRSAIAMMAVTLLTACGAALAVDGAADDHALAACRTKARVVRRTGASSEEAYGAYERCKHDAGLP